MKNVYVGPSHNTPDRRCPKCGHLCNAATSIGHENSPKEGAITVCIECATVLIFDERLTMRTPTEAEWEEINANLDYRYKIDRVRAALKSLPPRKPR